MSTTTTTTHLMGVGGPASISRVVDGTVRVRVFQRTGGAWDPKVRLFLFGSTFDSHVPHQPHQSINKECLKRAER